MQSKALLQFNATTGAYEGKFTEVPINAASGFDFSFQTNNPDLYITGQYAGNAWARFNSTDGKVTNSTPVLVSWQHVDTFHAVQDGHQR